MSVLKVGLGALGAGLAGVMAGYWFARRVEHDRQRKEVVKEDEPEEVFYDVLFFPDSRVSGFDQMCKQEREIVFRDVLCRSPSLQKMKEYLLAAEKR